MSAEVFAPVDAARPDDLRIALAGSGLPTDDLAQPGRTFFRLSDADGPVGFVGLESEGPDRLLRSLVVLPDRRGQGHGRRLVALVEAFARQAGADRLHLLTTGAGGFFRELGYRVGSREAAPAAITRTAQFASLCPADADYLVKDLA